MINLINSIWFSRNQLRFKNKKIHWKSSLNIIKSNTALCGNLSTAVASNSLSNFVILKKFEVTLHPPKAPRIIEVLWKHPPPFWVKCNTDKSTTDHTAACGGIFRDHLSDILLCFPEKVDKVCALHAEFFGAIRAIELANKFNWRNLWLECDSTFVINAIRNKSQVPWSLRNRWENCLSLVSSMNFLATHVYI